MSILAYLANQLLMTDKADIETTFSISNFGAIVELDKALYNWTDTVYITITAPDHNNNSAAEETIGTSALPIQVTTRSGKMCTSGTGALYAVAAETGPDTGVFTMEVALEGYNLSHSTNNPSARYRCLYAQVPAHLHTLQNGWTN